VFFGILPKKSDKCVKFVVFSDKKIPPAVVARGDFGNAAGDGGDVKYKQSPFVAT